MNFEQDLILSASRKSWKMSSTHGTKFDKYYEKKHKSTWDKVWKRDNNTCFFCQFKSYEYQEIHHLNDDHDDNSMDNLVTICPLCHQSFHLDTVSNTNGGKIIWLPEFSQQELNYISRAIFIATDEAEVAEKEGREVSAFAKIARMIDTSLSERSLVVEHQFQAGASEPSVFANALINMNPAQYDRRFSTLRPFKILATKSRFSIQTKYWRENLFSDIPPATWEKLIITDPVV